MNLLFYPQVSSGIGNFTDPHESRSSTEDKDEILEELQRCQVS